MKNKKTNNNKTLPEKINRQKSKKEDKLTNYFDICSEGFLRFSARKDVVSTIFSK